MGTENGNVYEGEMPFEDLKSFKIDLKNHAYHINCMDITINQLTDGAATPVEPNALDSETLSDIGNTELTLICAMSANDNDYDGATVEIPAYYDQDGVLHDAGYTATINTSDSTTEVVFDPAISDFYCFDPDNLPHMSMAVKTGHACYIGVTGLAAGDVMCTIQEESTDALPEDCFGVGSIFGTAEEDAANLEDAYMVIDYINYQYQLKHGIIYFDDTATEFVRVQEASVSNGVYTPNGKYVNDFLRRRRLRSTVAPAAGKNLLICDHDGATIYDVIQPLYKESIHSEFIVRDEEGVDTYLAYWSFVYQVADEHCTLSIAGTGADLGSLAQDVVSLNFGKMEMEFPPIKLEKGSELTWLLTDDGKTGGNGVLHYTIIEAWK